jgi:catechol 2,3-dioxygenase-like lactoylglutathione lyase family enzyme
LGITYIIKDLETAKKLYEDILGFEPGPFYGPTNWQSHKFQDGVVFAIGLPPG